MTSAKAKSAFRRARRQYVIKYGAPYGERQEVKNDIWPDEATHTKASWEALVLPRDQRLPEDTKPTDGLPY